MEFTTIINEECVYGITAARNAHNAGIPPTIDDPNSVEEPPKQIPNPAYILTDYKYLDFVLTSAIQSWCNEYVYTVQPLPAPPPIPTAQVTIIPIVPEPTPV